MESEKPQRLAPTEPHGDTATPKGSTANTPVAPKTSAASAECPYTLPNDEYSIVRKLDEGQRGEIWEAIQVSVNRRVAIRFLDKEYCTDKVLVRDFQRRARSGIQHDNVVEIIDFGNSNCGSPFYVMEFVDSIPLSDLLAANGPLKVGAALQLLAQISAALEEAHANRILHGDLRPENVLLQRSENGEILAGNLFCKLIDFGSATSLDFFIHNAVDLQFGMPEYIDPEAINDNPSDVRDDIYSFGCLAYDVLVGEPPFVSDYSAQSLRRDGSTPASILDAVAEPDRDDRLVALDEVIRYTLHRQRDNRPVSMSDLGDAIRHIANSDGPYNLSPFRERIARAARVVAPRSSASAPWELYGMVAVLLGLGSWTAWNLTNSAPPPRDVTAPVSVDTGAQAMPSGKAESTSTMLFLTNIELPCTPRAVLLDGTPLSSFIDQRATVRVMEYPAEVAIVCHGLPQQDIVIERGETSKVITLREAPVAQTVTASDDEGGHGHSPEDLRARLQEHLEPSP